MFQKNINNGILHELTQAISSSDIQTGTLLVISKRLDSFVYNFFLVVYHLGHVLRQVRQHQSQAIADM